MENSGGFYIYLFIIFIFVSSSSLAFTAYAQDLIKLQELICNSKVVLVFSLVRRQKGGFGSVVHRRAISRRL